VGGGRPSGRSAPSAAPAIPNLKAVAADPNATVSAEGTWTYTVDSPQGGNGKIALRKEGGGLTGTISNNRNNKETSISKVEQKGNELTITYEVNFGPNPMLITIKGTIAGDELNGNMSVGQFGTFPINAKREK
jgi:hypothetical protein